MSTPSTPTPDRQPPARPSEAAGVTRAARGRPARLDRDRTVDAALVLLDGAGLDALTMRRLAETLGVRAGALYRHFATKQDLLTAMAERMLAGCATAPVPDPEWSGRLTALAHRMRGALLAHRDGARVYAGTHATGPNTLGFAEAFVGAVRGAGFGDGDAARAVLTVVNFTVGHTLEEQAALQPGDGGPADPSRLREAVAAGAYPHLTTALPVLAGTAFAAHFDFGLDLLVEGLRAVHARGPGGPE
ncbi:TetR/AcrR family transcriptional regulator [Streptomyces sp. NPDC048507]|uniref:TetR/AcrR family transcriptional regulator n=1 Tax=Streptomyces sp. NPDC048507 TaxID=3365560 RepID=UPI003716ABDB